MNAIDATLTTSGNSVAVRLPKELLRMSGLGPKVRLEVKHGKIIISRSANPREGWDDRIKALIDKYGSPSEEFKDFESMESGAVDDLPWDGPSYEDWQKHAQ